MFKRHLLSVTMALSMVATATLPAHAYRKSGIPDRGLLPQTSYMAERGRVSAPFGHIEFCAHSPSECLIRSRSVARARLNSSSWRVLKQVNYRVNRSMRAKSDRAAHGKTDHWSVGGRVGDCEDYALTKRRELIRRGWSSNTLLVATARDRRNRMHAVLIAHTSRGDFVLDNLTGSIRAWNKTGYKWLKRQSRSNPKKWVRLNGRPMITGAIPTKAKTKPRKIIKARKASALALLTKIRGKKLTKMRGAMDISRPKQLTAKSSKAKTVATLPPLPVRNAARQTDTRIANLLARLKDVQKRLADLKKDENEIAQLLARMKSVQKRLVVKKIGTAKKTAKVKKVASKRKAAKKVTGKRLTIKKAVSKRKSVGKSTKKSVRKLVRKQKATKRANRQRSSTKALALLRKIRKAKRHKSGRTYKRRWTKRIYRGSIYSI